MKTRHLRFQDANVPFTCNQLVTTFCGRANRRQAVVNAIFGHGLCQLFQTSSTKDAFRLPRPGLIHSTGTRRISPGFYLPDEFIRFYAVADAVAACAGFPPQRIMPVRRHPVPHRPRPKPLVGLPDFSLISRPKIS